MIKEIGHTENKLQPPQGLEVIYETRTTDGRRLLDFLTETITNNPELKIIAIIGPTGAGKTTEATQFGLAIEQKFGDKVVIDSISAEEMLAITEDDITELHQQIEIVDAETGEQILLSTDRLDKTQFGSGHWSFYNEKLYMAVKASLIEPSYHKGRRQRVIALIDAVAMGEESNDRGMTALDRLAEEYPGQILVIGLPANQEIIEIASRVRGEIETLVKEIYLKCLGVEAPTEEQLSAIRVTPSMLERLTPTPQDLEEVGRIRKRWNIKSDLSEFEYIEHIVRNALPKNLANVLDISDRLMAKWIGVSAEAAGIDWATAASRINIDLPEDFEIQGLNLQKFKLRVAFMLHHVRRWGGIVALNPKLSDQIHQWQKGLEKKWQMLTP